MPKQTPGETEAEAQLRFTTELEFVQSLANPEYLHRTARTTPIVVAALPTPVCMSVYVCVRSGQEQLLQRSGICQVLGISHLLERSELC